MDAIQEDVQIQNPMEMAQATPREFIGIGMESCATCLGRILLPEHTTNFIWGGQDFIEFYITAATSIYRLKLKIAGNPLF